MLSCENNSTSMCYRLQEIGCVYLFLSPMLIISNLGNRLCIFAPLDRFPAWLQILIWENENIFAAKKYWYFTAIDRDSNDGEERKGPASALLLGECKNWVYCAILANIHRSKLHFSWMKLIQCLVSVRRILTAQAFAHLLRSRSHCVQCCFQERAVALILDLVTYSLLPGFTNNFNNPAAF